MFDNGQKCGDNVKIYIFSYYHITLSHYHITTEEHTVSFFMIILLGSLFLL